MIGGRQSNRCRRGSQPSTYGYINVGYFTPLYISVGPSGCITPSPRLLVSRTRTRSLPLAFVRKKYAVWETRVVDVHGRVLVYSSTSPLVQRYTPMIELFMHAGWMLPVKCRWLGKPPNCLKSPYAANMAHLSSCASTEEGHMAHRVSLIAKDS